MKFKSLTFGILVFGILICIQSKDARSEMLKQSSDTIVSPANEKLVIIWTSGDPEVAFKMVFMYTFNSKKYGWWDDVTLIVWGPSAKILSENHELQEEIKKIIDAGIIVKACKGCSDLYKVSEKLEELGVIVLYIGEELTDYIKEGRHILTF